MKLNNLFKWSAAHVAWLTMAMSPVAMGAEAEKLTKQKLAQYVQEFGLNKKTTLGQFWEKSKVYYPGYVYKELEAFVQQNRNLEMPEFIVSSGKASDGSEIPNLQLVQNGRVNSIQFFEQKNKWAKFNNTVLSVIDLQRPEDIFTRLKANDIRLKNEADVLQKKNQSSTGASKLKNQSDMQKDFARFNGFPRVTPQLWKSLTPIQRAGFFVNIRLLWHDAQKVLDTVPVSKLKKDGKSSSAEFIFNSLFAEAVAKSPNGTEVMPPPTKGSAVKPGAKPLPVAPSVPTTASSTKSSQQVYDAKSCIVAGYVGVYDTVNNSNGEDRPGCSVDLAIKRYQDRETKSGKVASIADANKWCVDNNKNSTDFIACNPIVYGYPSGSPACANKLDKSFQTATHFNQGCDKQSPLNNTKVPLFPDKDYSNIMPPDKRIAMIEADQKEQGFILTKNFLEGVLKSDGKDKPMLAAFQKGEWTKDLDDELVRIQNAFEGEIDGAIKTCEADIKYKNERNQKGACDQLHRRWLFTEKFLNPIRAKMCAQGTSYAGPFDKVSAIDANSQLCLCNSDKKTMVPLGKLAIDRCPSIEGQLSTFPPVKAAEDLAVVCPKGSIASATSGNSNCVCSNNPQKAVLSTDSEKQVDEKCEDKSNAWKWALGAGVGIIALLAIFNRHNTKKPVNPPNPPPLCDANKKLVGGGCVCTAVCPANQTQNSASCGCSGEPAQKCPAPKLGSFPDCSCPGSGTCASGQQIFDQSTCQCTNKPEPVTCPNRKVAPENSLTKCDKCPDGSFETTAGCAKPNEGGGGNNCPTGNCNGGGPNRK